MKRLTMLMAGCLVLAACSDSQDELQGWMEDQRRVAKPNVEPVVAPKKFTPHPYSGSGAEPFGLERMARARQAEQRPNVTLDAEMKRRKEPLEAFPLDSMAMVGTVMRGGRQNALLKVDSMLHYVKQGDYLGQNYGKITRIGETELALREIVQDAAGEWIERTSTLQIQEKSR
jgi:type IV pilus assembly protein PilP